MIQIFFDGCTAPKNPGIGGAGWMIYHAYKDPIGSYKYLGEGRTSNQSEYAALYFSLLHGVELGYNMHKVNIYGDSQLVVKQVNREWKNKKPHLQHLMKQIDVVLDKYEDWTLEWIPREKNGAADQMSIRPLLEKGINVRR